MICVKYFYSPIIDFDILYGTLIKKKVWRPLVYDINSAGDFEFSRGFSIK